MTTDKPSINPDEHNDNESSEGNDIFDNLDKELLASEAIIALGRVSVIVDDINVDQVEEIQEISVANEVVHIIDDCRGAQIAEYLANFQGLNHQEIANRLIDAGYGWAVANNLNNFQGLNHQEIANRLIDNGSDDVDALLIKLNNFQGLNHQEIANCLIDTGKGNLVAYFLNKFEGLDHNEIANRLIDNGSDDVDALLTNLNNFTDLNYVDFVNYLIDKGYGRSVVYRLVFNDEFQGLNHQEIVDRLIKTGQKEAVDFFYICQDLKKQDPAARLKFFGLKPR